MHSWLNLNVGVEDLKILNLLSTYEPYRTVKNAKVVNKRD